MKTGSITRCAVAKGTKAFTLAEVVISAAIAAMTISGIMYGYVQACRRAEWTGYSFAAQNIAIQALERTRAAKWDPAATVPIDELTAANFPNETVVLDLPVKGTNVVSATNIITITTVTTTPPLKMIRVECRWPYKDGQVSKVFTNTVVTYRGPET